MQWEYKLVDVPARPPVGDNRAIEQLNREGRANWEAVGVVPLSVRSGQEELIPRMAILLKRPISVQRLRAVRDNGAASLDYDSQRNDDAREALRALVVKVEVVLKAVDSGPVAIAAWHGMPYSGPTIEPELAQAKEVLGE